MKLDNEQIAIVAMFTIGVLLCFVLLTGLSSCKVQQPIVVERVVRDSVYIDRLRVDSTYIHDSIYIEARRDTITVCKYKTLTNYKILRDTAYISRIDSIPVIKEVRLIETKTENSKFARFTMRFFWIVVLLAVIWAAWKIVKRYYLRMP